MKVFILSHTDCDGLMPIVLAKLAFEEVTYQYVEQGQQDKAFLERIEELKSYDQIFMTDFCLQEETISVLPLEIIQKFHIFDHHITSMAMNQYPFIEIKVEENRIKQCGTSIFYDYLLKTYPNAHLLKKATSKLVELTRLVDTWDWKKENIVEANWLGKYQSLFGKENFITHFYNYLIEYETFEFDEKERFFFEMEDKIIEQYILEKEKEIIPVVIEEHRIGVVFAENNRSLIGSTFAQKYQGVYDFIMIINVSKSVSYRSVENQDVSVFATKYGGGGHKNAAGSHLPIDLKETIIKKIFSNAIIEEQR